MATFVKSEKPEVEIHRGRDLRSTLNLHRSNLVVAPAHRLQRGVVIVYLPLASHEVLLLKQHHLGLLVVLCAHDARKDKLSIHGPIHLICVGSSQSNLWLFTADTKWVNLIS